MVDRVTLMKIEILIIVLLLLKAILTLRLRRSSFQDDVELFLKERQKLSLGSN